MMIRNVLHPAVLLMVPFVLCDSVDASEWQTLVRHKGDRDPTDEDGKRNSTRCLQMFSNI